LNKAVEIQSTPHKYQYNTNGDTTMAITKGKQHSENQFHGVVLNSTMNRISLGANYLPTHWFNIAPYLPEKPYPAVLNGGQPADFDTLCHVFPTECVKQAATEDEYIKIPDKVRELYALCNRPTPIQRAFQLERALSLNSDRIKIYFKCEYVSPTGSHKSNTAIPQAYYAKQDGLEGLTTETGAGQWGSALSMACNFMGLSTKVFQVRASYDQKPARRVMMNNFGAELHPSPSNLTKAGRSFFDKNPHHPGSLGIAISEAVELAMTSSNYKYSLGSVLDFVCLHQSVIGLESKIQMERIGDYPDIIIGCIGGGSNFAGISFPFFKDSLDGSHTSTRFIGVEPTACPSLTKGKYTYDYGDSAKLAPMIKMYSLGSSFIPPTIHAGGLRYHGSAPLISMLKKHNCMESIMINQIETIEAGLLFSRTEGILPAVETNHAIAAAIREAKRAQENNEKKIILFNFSGHGFFDTHAYAEYHAGNLVNFEHPDLDIKKACTEFPIVDESVFR
jgi:tryptophan synthase beta chain